MAMDFTPVRKARLSQAEFAKLCGVSRVTANMWLREERPRTPNRFVEYTVALQLQRLSEAVAMGLLPLPGTVNRDERDEHIRVAIERADRQLKERARSAATPE